MTIPLTNTLSTRELWGGAVTLPLPTNYLDASDMRQIPDTQEVFLSPSTDTSVVIEVLQMVEEGLASTDLWEAIQYHFNSIAYDNSALSSTILSSPPSPPSTLISPLQTSLPLSTPLPTILSGLQIIHKFSHNPTGAPRPGREDDEPDNVWIGIALWRVNVNVDGKKKKADLVCSVNVNLSCEDAEKEREGVESWWVEAVGQLDIKDWDLFADE